MAISHSSHQNTQISFHIMSTATKMNCTDLNVMNFCWVSALIQQQNVSWLSCCLTFGDRRITINMKFSYIFQCKHFSVSLHFSFFVQENGLLNLPLYCSILPVLTVSLLNHAQLISMFLPFLESLLNDSAHTNPVCLAPQCHWILRLAKLDSVFLGDHLLFGLIPGCSRLHGKYPWARY